MIAPFDPNLTRIELRQEILRHLNLKGLKRKDLARFSGIEAVTISNLLNNKQCFMLYQLDAITAALGLPEGHFYPLFKGECFDQFYGRAVLSKCTDFIQRCLQLGMDDVAYELFLLIQQKSSTKSRAFLPMIESLYHSLPEVHTLPYYQAIALRGQAKREEATNRMEGVRV